MSRVRQYDTYMLNLCVDIIPEYVQLWRESVAFVKGICRESAVGASRYASDRELRPGASLTETAGAQKMQIPMRIKCSFKNADSKMQTQKCRFRRTACRECRRCKKCSGSENCSKCRRWGRRSADIRLGVEHFVSIWWISVVDQRSTYGGLTHGWSS